MNITGHWYVTLYGAPGEVKSYHHGKNIITDAGKSYLAGFLTSATTGAKTFTMIYIGVGEGATAEAATNTSLVSEIARVAGVAADVAGAIYRCTATFPSGTGTGAIKEYSLFNTLTSSLGEMFSRDTAAVVNKGANDELKVVTEITFS